MGHRRVDCERCLGHSPGPPLRHGIPRHVTLVNRDARDFDVGYEVLLHTDSPVPTNSDVNDLGLQDLTFSEEKTNPDIQTREGIGRDLLGGDESKATREHGCETAHRIRHPFTPGSSRTFIPNQALACMVTQLSRCYTRCPSVPKHIFA